jgi:hypothetical protein
MRQPLPWRPVMLNGYERQFVYVYGAVSPLQGDLDWMLCGEMNAVRMGGFLDQVSRVHNQDAYSIHGTHSNAWTSLRCSHMIRPSAVEQQGDIAGHKRSLSDMDNRPYDSSPGHGRGSRSGFRPTGLPVGLHKTAFIHLGGSFFPVHLTVRVSKARESIRLMLLSGFIATP